MAERIAKIIKDHGEEVTHQIRSLGEREAITNQAAQLYITIETIAAYISPSLTRRQEINGVTADEEVRTIYTKSKIDFQDRIVCNAGTFQIDETPQRVFKMQQPVFYIARMVRMEVL